MSFRSPLGLFPFQADAVVQAYFEVKPVVTLDTGLGKTIVSMALAAQLFDAGEIDLAIHVGRRGKIGDKDEFPADWANFTDLRTLTYHGVNRVKKLAQSDAPQVILTTYETGRAELMRRVKTGRSGKGGRADGPLMEVLHLRDKRVLWLFDEIIKLGNRGSETYQAYDYVISQLRRGPHRQRVVGFSATPMRVDYEQPFNIGRIVAPDRMPTVTWFEENLTYGRDDRSRLIYRKGAEEWFASVFEPMVYRKRITDPDVQGQMPTLLERAMHVDLLPEHAALYKAVGSLYDGREDDPPTTQEEDMLKLALKLTAGHPASHLHSGSKLSRTIVETMGEAALRATPSSKTLRLIDELNTIVRGQGSQALVFTFFAETVLPEVAADLRAAGFTLATYTGGQSVRENEDAKRAFKAGDVEILLSSDAGSEGLNLPEAHYIIEYESALTYDTRKQRFGRATRIVGGGATVFGVTMVARRTVEEGMLNSVLRRNALQDRLLGDTGADGHMGADERRAILKGA